MPFSSIRNLKLFFKLFFKPFFKPKFLLHDRAPDAHADLGEEAGVGEEAVEQERGGAQQELDGRAEDLAPDLGRVGNVRLALKLGKVLQSRPRVRSVFCPKKINHTSRLTLHSGYNLV